MSILHNNSMSSNLQKELGEYGLFRQKAQQGVKDLPTGENYFGVAGHNADDETKLFFPKNNISELDDQYGMEMAEFVPSDNTTHDLLEPTAFGKRLSMKNPKTIRNYLRRLLETV